jgi:hypothetical protein
MGKVKFSVITDIHYGFDVGNKLGSKAPRLMEGFIKAVNKYNPDCVVDMGDRISCRNRDTDMGYARQLKEQFNRVAAPVNHLVGNHDAKFMSREDNQDITGSPGTSYSKDYNGYHLVFWNPGVTIQRPDGLTIGDDELQWLKDDLAATDKPAIIFTHVPLDNDAPDLEEEMKTFSGVAGRFYYKQGHEVRKVMEEAGNVIMCMAGHRHTKRHREINGIHYITQQSFTSAWNGTRRPMGTFAFVEIEGDKISIALQGRDKSRFDLTAKPVAP